MKQNKSYRRSISRDDIEKYRTGDEQTRREIEGRSDNFDQDALDGWQLASAGPDQLMKKGDRKFIVKSVTPYLLLSAVIVIAGLGIYFFQTTQTVKAYNAPEIVRLQVEKTDLALESTIDTMTVLPEEKQINIETIKISQKEIQQQPESVPVTDIREIPSEVLPQKPAEVKAPEKVIITQKTAKEIYHDGLKLIDYSQYRSKPVIETEQHLLTGTPADQETKTSGETEVTITKVDVPYMDYIRKTAKYVNRGKWKEALQRLDIILRTYPDDVNGHFYAGLCSYNLQQYKAAGTHFRTCLQLQFSNFNEESSWYLAKSLVASGETEQAKELLIVIRDQKGYYAKQAEKLLKDIR